jgi:hypothetical protein
VARPADAQSYRLRARISLLEIGTQHFYVEGADALPTGDCQIRMEFAHDGGGLGKGGTTALYVRGQQVGTDKIRDRRDGLLRR